MGRKTPPPPTAQVTDRTSVLSSPSHPADPAPPVRLPPPEEPPPRGAPHVTRHDVALDHSRVDPDAQKVVRRLTRHGFQAYLVGGCVLDLLLERRPMDF